MKNKAAVTNYNKRGTGDLVKAKPGKPQEEDEVHENNTVKKYFTEVKVCICIWIYLNVQY